jgi:hypothetical protein
VGFTRLAVRRSPQTWGSLGERNPILTSKPCRWPPYQLVPKAIWDRNATCVGLLPNPLSETTTDNPMRFYGDIVAARPILAFIPSAPDRTVFSVRRWVICCAIPARPALLIHVPTARRCSLAGRPEHRTSSSSRAPCLPGNETPQRQIHHCCSPREVTIARNLRRAPVTELCQVI